MFDWFLRLFLFLLPFQFALNPLPSMDLPLGRVLAAGIFFWWLARALAFRSLRLPPPLITASIVTFLGIGASSLLWAEQTGFALRKFLFLLNFFPLLWVFYDQARSQEMRQDWLRALIAGAGSAAVLALFLFASQFFVEVGTVHAWLTRDLLPFFLGVNLGGAVAEYSSLLVNLGGTTVLRATALFPDPHIAAFFFGLTGFLTLGMFFQSKKKLWLSASLLLFFTDLLTFSRGGYLGLFSGMLVFVAAGWPRFTPATRKKLALGAIIGGLLLFTLGQPVLSRLVSSFTLRDASSTERLELWREALAHIQTRPFWGAGLGNYLIAVRPTAEYRTPYYAHNLYLDISAELGLAGLFFFAGLFMTALIRANKGCKERGDFVALGIFSALVLYLTHSFFETALYSVHVMPLVLLALALAWYDGDAILEYA